MTSRLKHKLDLEQINLKSSYLNESFVQIGTPLPALAESKKDKLEYVPEWQQEVRDEQGRRRFHGAFTGGYSAGYYNSVGSKEGWAPSTFKSSRSNRAAKTQRPEDFMDEEDLAQMKEDRILENTETFKSDRIGSTKAELADRSIPSALQSLIEPAKTSIGQTLLQKQGWRPGQGIGPRISLRRLKLQDAKSGPVTDIPEEGDDQSGKHLFAPRDTKLVVYESKEEKQGLGYVRGMGKGIERAKPLAIRANHVDIDDDDDPYSVAGPSTSARPFAFANEDEDEDMPVVIGGSTSTPTSMSFSSKKTQSSDIDTSRWHDGRPVLPGFELDPLGVPTDKWFEMPDIPPDWRPRPSRVWGSGKKWDEKPGEKKVEKEVIKGMPGRPLTFEQRGQALGEIIPQPPPSAPVAEDSKTSKAKSVFEYMTEKDRERIQAIAALARAGSAKPPTPLSMIDPTSEPIPEPSSTRSTEIFIPPLSPRTAGAALRGYAPYVDDSSKQDRYRSYLSSQTLNSKTPMPNLKTGTIDEINKELEDFASSARIFKPMSFAMSSRFTSGSTSLAGSDMKQAKPGLHMFDAEKAALAVEEAKKVVKPIEDDRVLTTRERAAKEGRYGFDTRVIKVFYPVKLVCRRFGIQDPHPEGEPKGFSEKDGDGGVLPKNDASWEEAFIYQPSNSTTTTTQVPVTNQVIEESGGERIPKSLAEVGMADDINQGRDILSYTKPSIDIFKAIFASDDEESDEEADDDIPSTSKFAPTSISSTKPIPVAGKLNESVADISTFKPVFQVKREREEPDDSIGGVAVVKKKKTKKKGKQPRGSLSFLVDEEEEGGGQGGGGGRKMERKEKSTVKKDEKGVVDGVSKSDEVQVLVDLPPAVRVMEEEDMWVEKVVQVPMGPPPVRVNAQTGGAGARKGAADFM